MGEQQCSPYFFLVGGFILKKLVDTNVILDFPKTLEKEDLIISAKVLKELDGLKKSPNKETAEKARRAAIYISRRIEDLEFDLEEEAIPTDDFLLKLAAKHDYSIITNDVYLKVRARAQGIKTEGSGRDEDYTGICNLYLRLDDNGYNDVLDRLLSEKSLPESLILKENQYLIVRDLNDIGNYLAIFCYQNSELIYLDRETVIENQWIGKLAPRNAEQVCLFHSLNNRNITVLYAGGGFGRGKSLLLNNYTLQELQREHIRKIIYVPNNAYVKNSMELGYLPGSSFDKTLPSIGPLVDMLGVDEILRMIQDERLEIVPIGFMRGRNFEDSIVLVSEAQNLEEDQVKLLIGRIGEGSRIFFDGSLKQIDSEIFKNKNGLRLLLNVANHPEFSKKFSVVKLEKIERSETARIADFLDEC